MKIAYRDRDAPCGCCRPPSPTCGLRRVLRGCGPWCAAVSTGSRGTPAGVSLSSGRVPAAVSARPPYRFRVRLAGSAAAGVGREAVHVHSEAVPVHVHEDTNGIRNQKTGGDVRETVVVCGNVNGWKSNLCAPAPQREKNKFHQLGDAADRCPFMRGPTRAAHRWRRPRKTHPFPARTRGSARRLRSRG